MNETRSSTWWGLNDAMNLRPISKNRLSFDGVYWTEVCKNYNNLKKEYYFMFTGRGLPDSDMFDFPPKVGKIRNPRRNAKVSTEYH